MNLIAFLSSVKIVYSDQDYMFDKLSGKIRHSKSILGNSKK